jgi:hypothetical protein
LAWNIDNPIDLVALMTFLVTSVVITRLASKGRLDARSAEERRKDMARLYQLALRLLSLEPELAAGVRVAPAVPGNFPPPSRMPVRWEFSETSAGRRVPGGPGRKNPYRIYSGARRPRLGAQHRCPMSAHRRKTAGRGGVRGRPRRRVDIGAACHVGSGHTRKGEGLRARQQDGRRDSG